VSAVLNIVPPPETTVVALSETAALITTSPQAITFVEGAPGPAGIRAHTYIVAGDEPALPNARKLGEGDGIAFDATQPGALSISLTTGVLAALGLAASAVQPAALATVAFSGEYADLLHRPTLASVATSGEYADLLNKPALFSGNYADLVGRPTLATVATSGAYADLIGKPALHAVATSGSYADLTNKPTAAEATAALDVFTATLKGLVPASGGGTTTFLRADGTWQSLGAVGVDVTAPYTWTGLHTFANASGRTLFNLGSGNYRTIDIANAGARRAFFGYSSASGNAALGLAFGAAGAETEANAITLVPSGTTIDSIALTATATTVSGSLTVNGTVTANSLLQALNGTPTMLLHLPGVIAWANLVRPAAYANLCWHAGGGDLMVLTSSGNLSVSGAITAGVYEVQQSANGAWAAMFSGTNAGRKRWQEISSGGPQNTWWFVNNMRHSNGANVWGVQQCFGWEDNANEFFTRNISAGTFGPWVRFLNGNNFQLYAPTLTGGGASGTWPISVTGNAAYASTAGSTVVWYSQSHPANWYLVHNWDGARWNITGNHGTPARIGYADYAGDAAQISAAIFTLNGKNTIDAADGYLRLNQTSAYGNGIYTPSVVRADGGFNIGSSRTIKRETGVPNNAAEICARLRIVLYRLLADDSHEQLGTISEEVYELCPWLSRDGKTVMYDRFGLLAIAALQELGFFNNVERAAA
jgi:hypothetical protein